MSVPLPGASPRRQVCSQGAQDGLIKQYTLNHIMNPYIFYAIFLSS